MPVVVVVEPPGLSVLGLSYSEELPLDNRPQDEELLSEMVAVLGDETVEQHELDVIVGCDVPQNEDDDDDDCR